MTMFLVPVSPLVPAPSPPKARCGQPGGLCLWTGGRGRGYLLRNSTAEIIEPKKTSETITKTLIPAWPG
jgi:hypothetical protein